MKYQKSFKKFIRLMEEGISIGQKKYGDKGLFGDSQLEMIKEEVRDLAVYAFLTWLKVDMLQRGLVKKSDLKELTGTKSINKFKEKPKKYHGVKEVWDKEWDDLLKGVK